MSAPDVDPSEERPAIVSRYACQPDPWTALRRHTPARIALGRVGASLPTAEVLAFSMARARARDAVHFPLDTALLRDSLRNAGFATLEARSQVRDRREYLQRPDLGRCLHPDSRSILATPGQLRHRLTVVVADGLSALAPIRHALPLLLLLRERLAARQENWTLDAIVLATQARVALGDEVGELRGAEAVVVLLGERPGLSSPDSLGVYLTYAPRKGRSDAERNCISNVRPAGIGYPEAACLLHALLDEARRLGLSGVKLKAPEPHLEPPELHLEPPEPHLKPPKPHID